MKRMLLFVWVCIAHTTVLFSQSPSQAELEAQIEHAMAPLDLSPVTTYILQDRTVSLGRPQHYTAHTEGDSLYCSMGLLHLHYLGLYGARILGHSLPSPKTLYEKAWKEHDSQTTVPIALLGMKYHRFVPKALELGILTSSGDQLHHGTGHPAASAYEERYMLSSGFFTTTWSQNVTLTLGPTSIMGTHAIDPTSVSIDIGDGTGYRPIPSTGIALHFSTSGSHTVKLRFSDTEGRETVHYHKVKIVGSASVTDGTSPVLRGDFLNMSCEGVDNANDCDEIIIGSDTLLYAMRSACPGGDFTTMRRPFVILDGIDLTWTSNLASFERLLDERNQSQGLAFPAGQIYPGQNLGEVLSSAGYDVIWVDWYDHHNRIQDNAALVQELLRVLSAQLDANGSSEPIRMMGISMGGVIGKYALLSMEKRGEDHRVDKFFTFDSPMQGANVPLALQGALAQATDLRIPFVGGIEKMSRGREIIGLRKVLSSPAGLQLSRYNIFDPAVGYIFGSNLDASDTEHLKFFQELESLGELQQCEYFAISNGSNRGMAGRVKKLDGTLLNPGDLMFSLDLYDFGQAADDQWVGIGEAVVEIIDAIIAGPVLGIILSADDNTKAIIRGFASGGSPNSQIYFGDIDLRVFLIVNFGSEVEIRNTAKTLPLDGAAGGKIGGGFFGLNQGALDIVGQVGGQILVQDLCFIPAVSALDIQGSSDGDLMYDNPNIPLTNGLSTPVLRWQAEEEPFYGPDLMSKILVYNNLHVTMTTANIGLISSELIGPADFMVNPQGGQAQLVTGTYNYGDSGVPDYIQTVPDTAYIFGSSSDVLPDNIVVPGPYEIKINQSGKIRYVDQSNPQNTSNSHFDVYIKDLSCTPGDGVFFESQSYLKVGDAAHSNTGRLTINENAHVHMKSGSTAIVDDGSSIVVKKDGTLELYTDSKVFVKGQGKIVVEPGGKLIIHDGVKMDMELPIVDIIGGNGSNYGSRIHMAGDLIVDKTVEILGQGGMIFEEGHTITSTSGAITLAGHGVNHPSYVLHSKVAIADITTAVVNAHVLFYEDLRLSNNVSEFSNFKLTTPRPYMVRNVDARRCKQMTYKSGFIEDVAVHARYKDTEISYIDAFNAVSVVSEMSRGLYNYKISDAYAVRFENSVVRNTDNTSNLPPVLTGLPTTGVWLVNNLHARFERSIIENYNEKVTIDPKLGPTYIGHGIFNDGTPYIHMEGTLVDNCIHGVHNIGKSMNLFMLSSTIRNSVYGIWSLKQNTEGLLKMICSRLENNSYGLHAEDFTLAIDGLINSQSTDGDIRPNYFSNKNSHFDIHYENKELPDTIRAHYNTWVHPELYNIRDNASNATLDQSNPMPVEKCGVIGRKECNDPTPQMPLTDPMVSTSSYLGLLGGTATTCDGINILDRYWDGYTCMYNGDIETATGIFTSISTEYWSENYTTYTTEIQHILQEVMDILDIDTTYTTTSTTDEFVSFEISTTCDTLYESTVDPVEIHFLLDASGSINSTEFNQMKTTLVNTLNEVSASVSTFKYSVSQFSATGQFAETIPLTSDKSLANTINRAFYGETDVKYAAQKLYGLMNSGVHSKVILFTDAVPSQFKTPPFDAYDAWKSPGNAEVTVVRYQTGSADALANAICAQIASKGGSYTGPIANNPNDIDNNQGPRRFYQETFTTSIPGLGNTIVSCTEIAIPTSTFVENTTITWTTTGGGAILGDSINVTTIQTNGVGTYTVTIVTQSGCVYTSTFSFGNDVPETQNLVVYPDRSTVINGVRYTPSEMEERTTSSKESVIQEAILYPNPFNDVVAIDVEAGTPHAVNIYDSQGRKVYETTLDGPQRVDLSRLSDGVYMTTIVNHTTGTTKTLKLIKL